MNDTERRREQRHSCNQQVGVYLSQGRDDSAVTPIFNGLLTSLSRRGAGIALDEVMAGPVHLAYAPMESDNLQLNIVFTLPGHPEQLTVPAYPIWLDKVQNEDLPPFRIGVEFAEPLKNELFQQLNRQLR